MHISICVHVCMWHTRGMCARLHVTDLRHVCTSICICMYMYMYVYVCICLYMAYLRPHAAEEVELRPFHQRDRCVCVVVLKH